MAGEPAPGHPMPGEDPEQWLRSFEQRAERWRQQAEEAQAALADVTVTMTSRDQSVTVTVNPGGVLERLQFSPRAGSLTLVQLATTTMDVYRQACAAATHRTTEIMSDLVGEDSEAIALLRRVLRRRETAREGDRRCPASKWTRTNWPGTPGRCTR